ncbi:DUF1353 domain-containing protein [Parachitinimonas caeni]|uniref:DUF1353 domain-containing protein n=1 Tax=Parachitinimonas caeni TaxID=3031301 RepID=A0ABT7DWN7_9NEIS|nr:DUF1353 domain-containing protein [Parachitinimonas caeni]MDK2124489.1 DUF1353 domain-containing protein [Parachitinimonas caeni]
MPTAQPHLSPMPTKEHYLLIADYTITAYGQTITVPRFFHYDGASVPAIAWQATYEPFHPDVMAAALVHDWLYYVHHANQTPIDRDLADNILETLFRQNGVSYVKLQMMMAAVRMAGYLVWDNSAENKAVLKHVFTALKADGETEPGIWQKYCLRPDMF